MLLAVMELGYWRTRSWSNQECFNYHARRSPILAKLEEARSEWVDGEMWDVKAEKLDRKMGTESGGNVSYTPFWRNKDSF